MNASAHMKKMMSLAKAQKNGLITASEFDSLSRFYFGRLMTRFRKELKF